MTDIRPRWTEEAIAEAYRLRAEGKTHAQIGVIFGRSTASINEFFKWRRLTAERRRQLNERARIAMAEYRKKWITGGVGHRVTHLPGYSAETLR